MSGALHKHHRGSAAAARLFGQARDRDVFLEFAQAVGHFVFMADVGEALEFAGGRRGHHYVLARAQAAADFGHESRDVAVIARGGLRLDGERSDAFLREA